MERKKLIGTIGIVTASFLLSGCFSRHLTLHFNGRTVEIQSLESASFPRGVEIVEFDGSSMRVNGRESITINGEKLEVDGSQVRLGEFDGRVEADQKLVARKNGEFRVQPQGGGEGGSSWWQFWR